ncbi:alpha-hydroxy acid oxidase [Roseomonas elaeocarpi]|uniref:Alpha-hydroxy acid oxidase n=1 Tax=Roseomonas elaeocarpi TaxID=907779 RepID=A0ABV6JNF0_9PROT
MNLFGFDLRWTAPETLVTVEDYRRAARRRLPAMVWSYVDGGAEGLETLRDNREAFSRWALRARMLAGNGTPSLATTVAGVPLSMPVLFAPTGFLGLSQWQGDLHAARAAAAAGTRYVVSTASSWSLEEIAQASPEGHFFQLYPREGDIAAKLMRRAWNAGYRTMMVTVDVPVVGNREAERHTGMGIPPVMTPRRMLNIARYPGWAINALRHQRIGGRNLVNGAGIAAAVEAAEIQNRQMVQATLNWNDFQWMREQWKGKLYIKGILDPEDAVRAVRIGADGVVVSNHGGRQLDFALSSLEALPGVVAAVGNRAEVLLDSGVRRGTDVLKALALGARAVMVGRPYVYGVTVGGERGARGVLDIFRTEMERSLSLMGCPSVEALDRSWVVPRQAGTQHAAAQREATPVLLQEHAA